MKRAEYMGWLIETAVAKGAMVPRRPGRPIDPPAEYRAWVSNPERVPLGYAHSEVNEVVAVREALAAVTSRGYKDAPELVGLRDAYWVVLEAERKAGV